MTADSPQRDAIQESMEAIAYRIADMIINLRGTGGPVTIDIGDCHLQTVSYDANQLLRTEPCTTAESGQRGRDIQHVDLASRDPG